MSALQSHQSHPLTPLEFTALLERYSARRVVDAIHVHELVLPPSGFHGHRTIAALKRAHTRGAGLADLAYHAAVDVAGGVWIGRNWSLPPASEADKNGDSRAGPFALALFVLPRANDAARRGAAARAGASRAGAARAGRGAADPQRAAAADVIHAVRQKFGLGARTVRYVTPAVDAGAFGAPDGTGTLGLPLPRAARSRRGSVGPARSGRLRGQGRPPHASRDDGAQRGPFADEATAVSVAAAAMAVVPPPSQEFPGAAFPGGAVEEGGSADAAEPERGGGGDAAASPIISSQVPEFLATQVISMKTDEYGDDAGAATAGLEPWPGAAAGASAAARDGGGAISPQMLADLRPHVVNLNQGQFSGDGLFRTRSEDVDAIFGEHLEQAVRALQDGAKLRLLFFAHGGLVKESAGLAIAHKHVAWWKDNGVYPLYFVWETGFAETLNQLLSRGRRRFFRRDLADYTSDPLLEMTARALQGPRIWGGMKLSARRASEPGGGAMYVAQKLKSFCAAHPDRIELHAAGHSAGAVFHSYFLPAALDQQLGVPFTSVHFLAPAVRVDTFVARLMPRLGKGVNHLSIFTMNRKLERDDFCGSVGGVRIYNKSLLYLIYHALEPRARTAILGLEECLQDDPALRALFGLSGSGSGAGEVVWSRTPNHAGRSASRSITHGGFDDDAATMGSVVRRVLSIGDEAGAITEYPTSRGARDFRDPITWEAQVDWPDDAGGDPDLEGGPEGFGPSDGGGGGGGAGDTDDGDDAEGSASGDAGWPPPAGPFDPPQISAPDHGATGPVRGGRRRALCVGIDDYPTAPLAGCAADARLWAATLTRLGFEQPRVLLDRAATRESILRALRQLVTASAPGDIVVFQYSGHGTQLDDVNGDEVGGDTPGEDEAICPFDFADGAFVTDDDVAEVFATTPQGVGLTCFIDCCHSGTISRFAVGTSPQARAAADQRVRFMEATPEMRRAHAAFRAELAGRRAGAGRDAARPLPRGPEFMREVVFSACLSREVAWESNGQGDFTRRATRLLPNAVAARMSHAQFHATVVDAFGAAPRQHPYLDCSPVNRDSILLAGAAAGGVGGPKGAARAGDVRDTRRAGVAGERARAVADLLRAVAGLLGE